jgi:hypothetical protein
MNVHIPPRYLQNPKSWPKNPQPLKQIMLSRSKPQRLRVGLVGYLTGARLGDTGDVTAGALGASATGEIGEVAGSVASGARAGAAADGVDMGMTIGDAAVGTVGAAPGEAGAAKGDATGTTGAPAASGTATGATSGEAAGVTAGAAAGADAGAATGTSRKTGAIGATGRATGATGAFGAEGATGASGTGVQTNPAVFFVRRVIALGSVYIHMSPVEGENEMPSGFRAATDNGISKVETIVPFRVLCMMRSLSLDRTNSVFPSGSYVIPARSLTFDVQDGRLSTSIRTLNTPVATFTDQIRRGFFSVRT